MLRSEEMLKLQLVVLEDVREDTTVAGVPAKEVDEQEYTCR